MKKTTLAIDSWEGDLGQSRILLACGFNISAEERRPAPSSIASPDLGRTDRSSKLSCSADKCVKIAMDSDGESKVTMCLV